MDAYDFDAARNGYADRPPGFILGGVTFRVVWGVPPELVYGWEDAMVSDDLTALGILEANDRLVCGYLDPRDRDAWAELRARETDPVTSRDIWALIRWLREVDVGRPTMPPESSELGRDTTEVSSGGA